RARHQRRRGTRQDLPRLRRRAPHDALRRAVAGARRADRQALGTRPVHPARVLPGPRLARSRGSPPMTSSVVPALPEAAASPGWPGGRIAAVVIGGLLALFAVALLAAGGLGLWGETQRNGGYVTPAGHEFATSGSALAAEKTKLGSSGVGWLYA